MKEKFNKLELEVAKKSEIKNEHNELKTRFKEKNSEIEDLQKFAKTQKNLLNKVDIDLNKAEAEKIKLQNKVDQILHDKKLKEEETEELKTKFLTNVAQISEMNS
eukprot:CAMPEP_0204868280 /NCGR_PEP_ID=MMETSP1348-20121228/26034_1 /ASSEMBLY_ACC=CAM_ASM_000700 /TAXON_ID=215587 /ORGANISM="Aplanochytrium stocchinoi, Strain GSBS06" /LENGTH=104 /DNA_ID=CAMNT_0052021135 /DNA_START=15 /DNA_END=326 /DNA_ORIENTATION=+